MRAARVASLSAAATWLLLLVTTATPSAVMGSAVQRSGARAARAHKQLTPTGLPAPARLAPFSGNSAPGEGVWHPAGRLVGGEPAVYETVLVPPGGGAPAGVAWMDTRLLAARLYSGSASPGWITGGWKYTAPVLPGDARRLVAAFNGGFKFPVSDGGYYSEGHLVFAMRDGAASLVIYKGGGVTVGAWGSDVRMTSNVASVRQNLNLLVNGGQPTQLAGTPNWGEWGATCGASSCNGPGIEHQWRSGLGVTANGALVYVLGPGLAPLELAQLLARAGAVRAMELDINPDWPVLATYDPPSPNGLAAPANGTKLLATSVQGPWTFFEPWWARDFVTMLAR